MSHWKGLKAVGHFPRIQPPGFPKGAFLGYELAHSPNQGTIFTGNLLQWKILKGGNTYMSK
jgi:hypothetical protein